MKLRYLCSSLIIAVLLAVLMDGLFKDTQSDSHPQEQIEQSKSNVLTGKVRPVFNPSTE